AVASSVGVPGVPSGPATWADVECVGDVSWMSSTSGWHAAAASVTTPIQRTTRTLFYPPKTLEKCSGNCAPLQEKTCFEPKVFALAGAVIWTSFLEPPHPVVTV